MSVFRHKWYDILLNLRKEDTQTNRAPDILYHKIKRSRKLEFGLKTYARLPDARPEKTNRFLLGLIDRPLQPGGTDPVTNGPQPPDPVGAG